MLRSDGRGSGRRAADLDDGPDRRVLACHGLVAERHMMRAAVDAVDDQRHPVAQLVGQPLADHAADDGRGSSSPWSTYWPIAALQRPGRSVLD